MSRGTELATPSQGCQMSFQARMFLQLLTIALALITAFAYCVNRHTKTAFKEIEDQQEQAQISQLKQQFTRFGDEVVRRVESIANAETTTRMAMDLARPKADKSLYAHEAIGAAQDQNLDFLEITTWNGTVISSISSTAVNSRTRDNSMLASVDWSHEPGFLEKQRLPDGDALLVSAIRSNGVEGKKLYVIGGRQVDERFLSLVALAPNVRVLLYRNFDNLTFAPNELLDRNGVVGHAQRFAPLIQQVQGRRQPAAQTIEWTDDPTSAEAFYALPLCGRGDHLLGIFLVGSSRRELVLRMRRSEWFAVGCGAAAFVVAFPICFWFSMRVSHLRADNL